MLFGGLEVWNLFLGGSSIRWATSSSLRYGFLDVLECSCLKVRAYCDFGVLGCNLMI